jgi:M6 family metalloprotease-like protein
MRWLGAGLSGFAIGMLALMLGASVSEALENGQFGWRAEPVAGSRPLLVIWLREAGEVPENELSQYRRYFEETFFDKAARGFAGNHLSVIAYFQEVSAGKFTFERAGLVGPLTRTLTDKKPREVARLAIEAAAGEKFDFKALDRDGDGRIGTNELTILVISNAPSLRGFADFTAAGEEIAIPGQNVSYAGRSAIINENDDFATTNRALFHILAPHAIDLDGMPRRCFAINGSLTLMAAGNTANSGHTLHLDPWHKMLAGWVEPRLFTVNRAGSAELAAQHVLGNMDAKRPVLIYDGARGPSEFFLLEYRTRSRLGFDQDIGTSGLVIWQVALDSSHRPAMALADRKNCRGETLQVPTLFVRGAPDWQFGGGKAYSAGDGPITLKWRDGTSTGVYVTVDHHSPVDWKLRIWWPAGSPAR